MEITVGVGNIVEHKSKAIVVNLFEGVTNPGGSTGAVDKSLNGAISLLIKDKEIKGKLNEITLVHTLGKIDSDRVVVVGLGKQPEFDTESIRKVSATVARYLQRIGISEFSSIVHGAGIGQIDEKDAAQAMVEGTLQGLYRFDKYKSDKDKKPSIKRLNIVELDKTKIQNIQQGVKTGTIISDAVNLCRDLVNEPANKMTPTRLAEVALEVAVQNGMDIRVLDKAEMKKLGMGAILGVAQGSDEEPKLIVINYNGDNSEGSQSIGFLGKGITFDTGGLDLKNAAGMRGMNGDMAGGAAVLAAVQAIARLKPSLNLMIVIPATENGIDGKAQRPGDVVKTMSGKTIEIDNTDAEGRLVLADALSYVQSQGVSRIVDVATLTGAISTSLGNVRMGVFGNDQNWIDAFISSGEKVGEKAWQFPMDEEYKKQYKSDIADIKNTGGRNGGSITGAQIIGEFAGDTSWVHIDIAGVSRSESLTGYTPKGATGVPVRTLVQMAMALSNDSN